MKNPIRHYLGGILFLIFLGLLTLNRFETVQANLWRMVYGIPVQCHKPIQLVSYCYSKIGKNSSLETISSLFNWLVPGIVIMFLIYFGANYIKNRKKLK